MWTNTHWASVTHILDKLPTKNMLVNITCTGDKSLALQQFCGEHNFFFTSQAHWLSNKVQTIQPLLSIPKVTLTATSCNNNNNTIFNNNTININFPNIIIKYLWENFKWALLLTHSFNALFQDAQSALKFSTTHILILGRFLGILVYSNYTSHKYWGFG